MTLERESGLHGELDLGDIFGSDWRGLARTITAIENRPAWSVILPPAERPVHIVGITGPPGAGKSTLTGRLVETYLDGGTRVAVLAVDPSSPISGGAVLGDRVRMPAHLAGREDVFIRSIASRGSQGAIAGATRSIARLLELSGAFDVILIETVGAGQTEVAIADLADTVALVTVPGLGDAVQAIKAGLMEVADLIVVNMADRPGARDTERHLKQTVGRDCFVTTTIATEGVGLESLHEQLELRWEELQGDRIERLRTDSRGKEAALIAEDWIQSSGSAVETGGNADLHSMVQAILDAAARGWGSGRALPGS